MIGQITEPGRDFTPSTNAVEVRAIFNQKEIAFLVSWHDMRAETSGHNAPDLAVSEEEEAAPPTRRRRREEEGGDFWGEAAAPAAPAPPAPPAETTGGDEGGGFWDEAGAAPAAAATADTEFSDAVGLQFPTTLPSGVVLPYFLFGDATNPVELWFADLGAGAGGEAKVYTGHGSADLAAGESDPPEVAAAYTADGWSVAFKRARQPRVGIGFAEETFVPVAFTVWDGFNRERGNKRALSAWQYVYVQSRHRPSPAGPIAKAGLAVLAVELLVVGWVRRRKNKIQPERDPAPRVTTQ